MTHDSLGDQKLESGDSACLSGDKVYNALVREEKSDIHETWREEWEGEWQTMKDKVKQGHKA